MPTLVEVCRDTIAKLESLPVSLGYANDSEQHPWPIRDELVNNLRAVVNARCVWTPVGWIRGEFYWRAGCTPNHTELGFWISGWSNCPLCGVPIERKELPNANK